MGDKNQQQPSPPSAGQSFQQGLQTWLKFLPKMLAREQQARTKYDPKRILEQQMLQRKYGPEQYRQQLQALNQLDPYFQAIRGTMGTQVGDILSRGYIDPRQNALYGQLGSVIARNLAQGGIDPTQAAAYRALGQGTMGQYALGARMDPEMIRQNQQYIRSAQGARGNVFGNAPISAEALYLGNRGEQLRQARTQNLQNYLGLQAPEAGALNAAYGYMGLQAPQERALALGGTFLSGASPISQVSGIQGVSPDRSFAYVNPQAGYMGQQFALSSQPYQYMNQNQTNPWSQALGLVGGVVGGIYGGAGGAQLGSAGGSLVGSWI